MDAFTTYPLGQLFGKPFEKHDFAILTSTEIFKLIRNDANTHVHQFHQHDFYAIFWIESGQLLQRLDGESYTLKKGDVFIACPGQVHENDFGNIDQKVEGGAILFTTEFLTQLKHNYEISELTFLDNVFSVPHLALSTTEAASFVSIAQVIFQEMGKDISNGPLIKTLLSAQLLLMQHAIDTNIVTSTSKKHIEVYKQFKHFLERYYKENKTPTFYADLLHISERHLNRLLKEASTKTAAEMVRGRSILEARRLLCFTAMPISDIAWNLGYQDQSYFTKLFKKKTGQTPHDYRASMSRIYQSTSESS